jgi:hypothetical protein
MKCNVQLKGTYGNIEWKAFKIDNWMVQKETGAASSAGAPVKIHVMLSLSWMHGIHRSGSWSGHNLTNCAH